MKPDTHLPSPPPPSLGKRILQAGAWSLSGYALSQTVRFGSNLVMTRLLMPEMFGIMAIANLLMVSLTLLSDLGLCQNIVQSRRGDDPVFLGTAWAVQILRGALLGGIALALAGLLYLAQQAGLTDPGRAYGNPLLPRVIAWVAASAPICGFLSIRIATAVRHLQQKQVVWVEVTGQITGICITLAWAFHSPSIWALVAGNLGAATASVVASHLLLAGPRHRLAWDPSALAELLNFGRWILLSSTIGILAASADRLFLGAVVDAHILGVYAIGQLIVNTLENGVAKLFVSVSLPAMSEAARRDPAELRRLYYRLLGSFDLFLFFIAGFLFAGGKALIMVLYDARYAQAGSILAVLALALPAVRFSMAFQLYLAVGQPRLVTLINGVRLGALAVLLPIGFWLGGFGGVVWVIALHNYLTAPLVLYFNRRLGVAFSLRELGALPCFPLGLALGWLLGAALAHLGLIPPTAGWASVGVFP
ncbi:MAG TPA: oligosaccharide flippase family protein [Rhodocyclaceae bacterium]|nr:oligosaccharide flippase family protein [Rhodocyclaceae bacterium]